MLLLYRANNPSYAGLLEALKFKAHVHCLVSFGNSQKRHEDRKVKGKSTMNNNNNNNNTLDKRNPPPSRQWQLCTTLYVFVRCSMRLREKPGKLFEPSETATGKE